MRNLILSMMLIFLAVFGAGCFKKEENPYKNLVPTGSAPTMPVKPTSTPVIPSEAKNIPLPYSGN